MSEETCPSIEALRADPARFHVIDVRDPDDHAAGHADGAVTVPLARLLADGAKVPAGRVPVTVCGKGGGRSAEAAEALRKAGHADTAWLCGDTKAWMATVG